MQWRVGTGCRGPTAHQLGPFTRFQWALRGQLASQLLEGPERETDYQGLVGEME